MKTTGQSRQGSTVSNYRPWPWKRHVRAITSRGTQTCPCGHQSRLKQAHVVPMYVPCKRHVRASAVPWATQGPEASVCSRHVSAM